LEQALEANLDHKLPGRMKRGRSTGL
jgi:hypothetical protein